jgi:hypothetical protein
MPPTIPNTSTAATVAVPSQNSDRRVFHSARKSRNSNRPSPATMTMPASADGEEFLIGIEGVGGGGRQ